MSDEKLKEEIKQVVTNLGNIEFTIEDELEFCKQVLKRKEQECEAYQKQFKADTKEMEDYQNTIVRHLESIEHWVQQFKAKEQECERLKATLKVIANMPCLNINDCDGNCLPHCKWNAHKLAQEALKELE